MTMGEPVLCAVRGGCGGAELVSTGTAATVIAHRRDPWHQPPRLEGRNPFGGDVWVVTTCDCVVGDGLGCVGWRQLRFSD
jgi:hypothetical protein